MRTTASLIGYRASIASFLGALSYTVAQIFSPPLLPILHFPWNEILIVFPSIVLSISLVIAISCLHTITPEKFKPRSQIALSMALMYSVIVSSVYILQLATVIPGSIRDDSSIVASLSITKAQPVQAVDGLGYFFLGLSALFLYPIFDKAEKARKWFMFHGIIAPFSIIPLWIPQAIVISTLWFVTAPAALFYLAKYLSKHT